MSQAYSKPTAAFVLSLIGGLFIVFAGIIIGIAGFALTILFGGFGALLGLFGLVWGILVIVGAVMTYTRPEQHTIWGIIILVFSILSWVGAAAGLFIGFLLGLIGGILAITWNPPMQQGYASDSSFPPQQ